MLFRSVLMLLSLIEHSASVLDFCTGHSAIQVEAIIFSGTPNPTFTLTNAEQQGICALAQQANGTWKIPTCRVLGFTGWKLCDKHDARNCVVVRGEPLLDSALFATLLSHDPSISASVTEHIQAELHRLHQSNVGDSQCAEEEEPSPPSSAKCKGPIVGPDDPKKVHYDPQHDDKGCFVTEQGENNCYDYANDIVTNSFAQPGRGSGVCPPNSRPCVKNTCEDVKNAAVSDGLTWIGTELPTSLPSTGHYVSLHIWPKSNFHWLRMDADMYWSHKPGGTQVRNVDNNNKKITDPAKADVSPWSDHCGYLLSVPSKGTIKEQIAESYVTV